MPPFVTVIRHCYGNLEPGDNPLLLSTDSKGSFRCTQPEAVLHTAKHFDKPDRQHWYMATPQQPTQYSNPGLSDHESHTLCMSPMNKKVLQYGTCSRLHCTGNNDG